MTRSLTLVLSLSLFASTALAQDEAKPNPARLKTELSDQVEDLLRAIRDGKSDVATRILEGWKPIEADLTVAFNQEGVQALGPKILAAAEETFVGTPAEIGERLGLDVTKLAVTVLAETTEGLESMAFGTNAAEHFASGLRRTSRYFNKQLDWYAVMTLEGDAPEDATGSYLQIFCRSGGRFVYLGKLWQLDGANEESEGGEDKDG